MRVKVSDKGFSLVELIIVIGIMAVLVGVAAPIYLKYVNNAKVSTDIANAEEVALSFNAGVADSVISLPTVGATSDYTASNFPSGLSIETFPECKLNASVTDWKVTLNELGVSKITLNSGQEIWPDPEGSNGYKTLNFRQ